MHFAASLFRWPRPEAGMGTFGWTRPILSVFALALGMAAAPMGAQASPRSAFLARYRCPLVALLEDIHRSGPIETSRNRFVSLAMTGLFQRYVQCIFVERDTAMVCEASSAAYGIGQFSRVRFVPTEETQNTLRQLGFAQDDPKKNYSQMVPLGSPPDVRIAADLMLATLYEAYGARRETDLDLVAPQGWDAHRKCGAPTR